jgi:CO/xanthine dehydrogenase FAD-binding subunit
MLLPKFDFHEPSSVSEACQILAQYGQKAKLLAGGTDLLVDMKKNLVSPDPLVSISRLDELKQIDLANDGLKIGACVTAAELAASDAVSSKWRAVCAGAKALGSPQIRNLATIGGNIGSASPAADMPPSLIAYGARIVLKKSAGERILPLENFFISPKRTNIESDELIAEIRIDTPPPFSGASYISLGIRSCQDIKIVNAASFITLESPQGVIKNARIALGCVGPTCLRALSAEKVLIGQKPGPDIFEKAAEAAMRDCSPRGAAESRASAAYKRDMVGVLTRRTLSEALKEMMKQLA